MTVILMIGAAATEPAHHEARQALRSRGELRTRDGHHGAADLVVAQLPPGARTVPAEVAEIARTASASGILLWASEPLVRPVTPVGNGNVVLASPSHRGHTLSALDILLGAPEMHAGNQALHRHWWCGWVLGAARPRFDVSQSDAMGVTFVHPGSACKVPSPGRVAAQILNHTQTDARRCSLLRDGLGADVHAVHLAPGGGSWLVHWPSNATPLWMYSALRMPARWSLSATLTATGTPFVRIPAFSGDLIVSAELEEGSISGLLDALPLGPLEIYRTLGAVVQQPSQWGVVVEVR